VMGKRRLAYPVQKQRFGTYVLLQFQGDGTGNARLNQDLELKENILAHMIVRIDKEEVREAREETSKEELTVPIKEQPEAAEEQTAAVEVEDNAAETAGDEQDRAEADIQPEELSLDEISSLAGKEDLEPETKE
ncbi:30S ribosomal protein S6, partial [Candidatus Neomarinimicrobiota bacterium]